MQVADKGFTYGKFASMTLSEVNTPPFKRGKKQLERMEIDWSWKLSIERMTSWMC